MFVATLLTNPAHPVLDRMTVESLREHLREIWPRLREQLLTGTYRPQPVKRQQIPKSDGGVRELGIPMLYAYCASFRDRVLECRRPRGP